MIEENIEHLVIEIDKRMSLVEADLSRMAGTRKIILSMGGLLILQLVLGAVGYGQLLNTVDNISSRTDTSTLEMNISTALRVVQDHGTELETLRAELHRMRANDDALWLEMSKGRDIISESTRSRFYREDAVPIYNRIDLLEKQLTERITRNETYIFGPSGAPQK